MNDVPNMNIFGAAKRPNIINPRGSDGGGSNLANSSEYLYVFGFFVSCGRHMQGVKKNTVEQNT